MMTKLKVYNKIADRVRREFPFVIAGLEMFFNQGKLCPDRFIDYLQYFLEMYCTELQGKQSDSSQDIFLNYVHELIGILIKEGRFSFQEWQNCRGRMFSHYLRMSADYFEKREHKKKLSAVEPKALLVAKNPPASNPPLFDGRELSPSEAAFFDFYARQFNERMWLKKNGITCTNNFLKLLRKKYFCNFRRRS